MLAFTLRLRRLAATLVACIASLVTVPASAQNFDLDNGNAPIEVVIPAVIPVIFATVAPSDAPLVIRTTTLLTNAFFDAIAPYHPTAVGVYSRLPRRPVSEGHTERRRNIAIMYASLQVLNSLYPAERRRWQSLMESVGLDPHLQTNDLSTPEGIGLAAGRALVQVRERDGMNQLGDAGGREFNLQPYADTTGYRPVNSAFELHDPGRWQPAVVPQGLGIYRIQKYVTPQWALTLPYSYRNPQRFRVEPPTDSNPRGGRYKAQADEVLQASAALDDTQKLTAELFNDKIASLGFVALFLAQSQRWSVERFVHYDFLVNLAAFDGGIAVWQEKTRYDAVRPFSAIRHLYGHSPVSAWGGPGRGAVQMPASQWTSYLPVADHPEYPSGSACFCSAHAQASRRMLGTDRLGWSVPYPQGSSRIEPGIVPAADTTLHFETWTQFEQACGQSRLLGGVHFQASIDASQKLCRRIGNRAWRFVSAHIAGVAPSQVDQDDDR